MKKAVMYGAGNIGRGFIGQLFHMSGYEIAFIDVNMAVVDKLNTDGKYPIYITEGEGYREYLVTGVSGVNGRDNDAIAEAIASADIMATAVGVNILKFIAAPFAHGVRRRMQKGVDAPLNIIICENMIGADHYLAEMIKENLSEEEKQYFDTHIALVEPSIGRMVPATPKEIAEKNPLAVCVEAYCELPVDKAAFKGEIPEIQNMVPFAPFDFYIRRKLFMHNMSHAITAYFGAIKGYTFFAKGESKRGLIISVVIAAVVLIIAWYISFCLDMVEAYQIWFEQGEVEYAPTFFEYLPFAHYDLMVNPAYFVDLLISLALGAVGCGSYVSQMLKRQKAVAAQQAAQAATQELLDAQAAQAAEAAGTAEAAQQNEPDAWAELNAQAEAADKNDNSTEA